MRLVICGLNHQTAPLPIREKLAFDRTNTIQALGSLIKQQAVNEAVLLSTCNRTEIYTVTEKSSETIVDWFSQQSKAHAFNISPYCYQYQDLAMIRHIMRVASGLDSMVLGESQILGQMKRAYGLANEVGAVGMQFKQLFPAVFAVSKQIRTQTAIGTHSVSIAYVVMQLAKRLFTAINKRRVLLIGAGETIDLIATYLFSQGVQHLIIANRTLPRAEQIARPFAAQVIAMADIPTQLKEVDIVITATTSQLPVLSKSVIESALRCRKHRPILIMDLAVPRDVEPEVSQLEDIYFYNLDDIQAIIQKNWQNRQSCAKQAETMIEMQALHYLQHLRILKVSDMIRLFRERYVRWRDQELKKAIAYWQKTADPQAALAYLAHNLTNKMLHQPTVKLRQAAYEDKLELLFLAKHLFEI